MSEQYTVEAQPTKAKRLAYAIFNDEVLARLPGSENKTFHHFHRLPLELRYLIWSLCVSRPRFIHLYIDRRTQERTPDSELYTKTNSFGNLISGYRYHTLDQNATEWHPGLLASVCVEARAVFRQMYRVRFPIRITGGNRDGKYIYINPDVDILWIEEQDHSDFLEAMMHCMHDLIAYDPKGIGITRLALTSGSSSGIRQIAPGILQWPTRKSITTLCRTSIQELFIVLRAFNSLWTMRGGLRYPSSDTVRHNRSIPLLPQSQYFTDVGFDPRSVKADLHHVGARNDPRYGVYCWNQFQAAFGSTRQIKTNYLVSLPLENTNIMGISTRDQLLSGLKATSSWQAHLIPEAMKASPWGNVRTREDCETGRQSLPHAVGMWELPLEAFGEVPQIGDEQYDDSWGGWNHNSIRDLSKFHPRLWCLDLC